MEYLFWFTWFWIVAVIKSPTVWWSIGIAAILAAMSEEEILAEFFERQGPDMTFDDSRAAREDFEESDETE